MRREREASLGLLLPRRRHAAPSERSRSTAGLPLEASAWTWPPLLAFVDSPPEGGERGERALRWLALGGLLYFFFFLPPLPPSRSLRSTTHGLSVRHSRGSSSRAAAPCRRSLRTVPAPGHHEQSEDAACGTFVRSTAGTPPAPCPVSILATADAVSVARAASHGWIHRRRRSCGENVP